MLTSIVDQAQKEEDEEQQAALQEKHEEEEETEQQRAAFQEPKEEPKAPQSFPATDFMNKLNTPAKEYKNEYERNLDQMAGDVYKSVPSRRNRLNTDKFGI